MKKPELKPCPFCGGKAYIADLNGGWYVTAHHKDKCNIRPDTWLMSNAPIKKQIKAWNRRVTDENA